MEMKIFLMKTAQIHHAQHNHGAALVLVHRFRQRVQHFHENSISVDDLS